MTPRTMMWSCQSLYLTIDNCCETRRPTCDNFKLVESAYKFSKEKNNIILLSHCLNDEGHFKFSMCLCQIISLVPRPLPSFSSLSVEPGNEALQASVFVMCGVWSPASVVGYNYDHYTTQCNTARLLTVGNTAQLSFAVVGVTMETPVAQAVLK